MRAGGRMASTCCAHWPCLCVQHVKSERCGEEASCAQERTDAVSLLSNMDIALLEQQYNSIREKQKRDTRVIYFAKASSTNDEISGKSLVKVVPIRQDQHNLVRQPSIQEAQFDFVRDPDNATWRTHLGMYRRTFLIQRDKHKSSSGDSTSTCTNNTVHSVKATDQLSDDCEDYDCRHHQCNKMKKDCAAEGLRKLFVPTVLSRQSSSGSSQSTHTPVSPYYPFPQIKCPKKSEAARRLGLYTSF